MNYFEEKNWNEYLNQVFGDMTVLSVFKKDRGNQSGHDTCFKVKCNICGTERNVNAYDFLKGQGQTHARSCSFYDTSKYESYVGTDIDDMHVCGITKASNNGFAFHCKCNVCGHEKDIRVEHALEHTGTSHKYCSFNNKNKYDWLIESTIGDMTIKSIEYRSNGYYAHVQCKVCGEEKVSEIRSVLKGIGMTHKYMKNSTLVPADMDDVMKVFYGAYRTCKELGHYQTGNVMNVPVLMMEEKYMGHIPYEALKGVLVRLNDQKMQVTLDIKKRCFTVTVS